MLVQKQALTLFNSVMAEGCGSCRRKVGRWRRLVHENQGKKHLHDRRVQVRQQVLMGRLQQVTQKTQLRSFRKVAALNNRFSV